MKIRRSTYLALAVFVTASAFFIRDIYPKIKPDEISDHRSAVKFVDVTALSGIDFRHVDGRSGHKFFVETLGCGVALFDFDQDGYLDIYFVNGRALPGYAGASPTNALYHNNQDGTFNDVTQQAGVEGNGYGVGCCVGDYDNDGYPDLYVTNYGQNQLYRNNTDGTFADVTRKAGVGDQRWGTGCAFADYDNDGDLDLYVANYVDFQLEKNPKCVKDEIITYCTPEIFPPTSGVLYRNNTDGTFTDVTDESGLSKKGKGLGVVWEDYDNDGDADLFVANDTMPDCLFKNNGNGSFTEVGMLVGVAFNEDGKALNGMGVSFGDYDNDENPDLIVTNFQDQPNSVLHNEGDGFFTDLSYASGIGEKSLIYLAWGVEFIDYDNDGLLDIFVANGHLHDNIETFSEIGTYAQPNQLFRNRGNGKFEDVSRQSGSGLQLRKVSRGMAYGDLDNDGDLDVVVTNLNQTPDVLGNSGEKAHHWLAIKCVGRKSNRDGIGARITVTTEQGSQIRSIRSGASYLSQSDTRAYFGLGAAKTADVEIRWPSGLTQDFRGVGVDRLLVVEEAYQMP